MMKLIEPYRLAATGLIIALLLAFAGFGFWRGMAAIHSLVETARVETADERNAFWLGEIIKSNAEVAQKRVEQAIHAAAESGIAEAKIAALELELTEREQALDELESVDAGKTDGPRPACGLDAGRVRLLNRK